MTSAIVVEDDEDTVEVFTEFLALNNIEILGTAENGLKGLKLYEETRPDLIFSDIWMPDYDGFYLLDNLKIKYPDAKIIMVTADLTVATDERLKASNADAVIFKPFNIEDILKIVENLNNPKMFIATNRL